MKQQQRPPYTTLDHTADLALRVYGDSLHELFANAALGMFAQMTDLDHVPLTVRRQITVEADDNEALLVAWLSELLFLRETKGEAYCRFEVRFPQPGSLSGVAEGGPWCSFDRPVKAVTYHGLKIEKQDDHYQATIVFDV